MLCRPRSVCVVMVMLWAGGWGAEEKCLVTVRTEAGLVRGALRGSPGGLYYSFRGVPYTKQPLAECRFQEPVEPEPWDGEIDATQEGPICPQQIVLYGPLMTPSSMSEECIHLNIHVPEDAPIQVSEPCRPSLELLPPHPYAFARSQYSVSWSHHYYGGYRAEDAPLRPIFVFIHGGGFSFGSGDADLHGPEHLVRKGVIVITFNYRLNALGFLSLNSTSVPGNAGLRDMVALLTWVQKNAASFGGDPDEVTLGGQSAGSAATHILSLHPTAKHLFKRFIMMSGANGRVFYSPSPLSAARQANIFLQQLNITDTDPDYIYELLTKAPLEDIQSGAAQVMEQTGFTDFTPVEDGGYPNEMIGGDLAEIARASAGDNTPRILGFTNNECQSFRYLIEMSGIVDKIIGNPTAVVPPVLLYQLPVDASINVSQRIFDRYFNGKPNLESYIKFCSDAYFIYPMLHTAELSGPNTYLYRFSYEGAASKILQNATGSVCVSGVCGGAAHIEDLMYVFKTNSYPDFPYTNKDIAMQDWMTTLFSDFIKTGNPTSTSGVFSQWLPFKKNRSNFLDIRNPMEVRMLDADDEMLDMKRFFDSLYNTIPKTE